MQHEIFMHPSVFDNSYSDMCGGKKDHCNQNIHFHLNQSYAPQPFGAIVWIQMVLMDMGHDYVCPVYIRNVLCIFVTLGRKAACSH